MKRGLQRNHSLEEPALSLNEKARFSEGSVSSLYNGSQSRWMKVSIVRLENRALSKSASQCFQISPSMSAHIKYICLFISVTLFLCPCHSPTLTIMLFMSCISASLLSAWLFFCLSSPISKHVTPPQQASRGAPWGNTPRVCFISKRVSACLRSQGWLQKLFQNKSSYKSTNRSNISHSNGARTSNA